MTNPKCAVCGHVNLPSAAVCEMCDARLYDTGAAGPAESHAGETYDPSAPGPGASARGFDAYGEEPRGGALPTDTPAPQFKGAGDVMGPTLRVYQKHFVLVGILVVVTTLPVALLQYAGILALTAAADEAARTGATLTFALTTQLFAGLLSFVGTTLLSGALVYAVVDIQRTGTAAAGESLRRGLRALPKVFLVTLLYTFVTVIGYILLIVPGIIFSLMYAVAVPVAVTENLGPFASLKRSAQLTDGYKGLIFLTYFLWGLIIAALNMLVSGSFLAAGSGMDSLPSLVLLSVVGGMLNSSTTVLTVYVFLGILSERRHGFGTRAFTPAPEAAR